MGWFNWGKTAEEKALEAKVKSQETAVKKKVRGIRKYLKKEANTAKKEAVKEIRQEAKAERKQTKNPFKKAGNWFQQVSATSEVRQANRDVKNIITSNAKEEIDDIKADADAYEKLVVGDESGVEKAELSDETVNAFKETLNNIQYNGQDIEVDMEAFLSKNTGDGGEWLEEAADEIEDYLKDNSPTDDLGAPDIEVLIKRISAEPEEIFEEIIEEVGGEDPGLSIEIDSDEFTAFKLSSGGRYEASVEMAEHILENYGDELIDERTVYGVASEIYVHDYLLHHIDEETNDQVKQDTLESARVLNVVFDNDAVAGAAELMSGLMNENTPLINKTAMWGGTQLYMPRERWHQLREDLQTIRCRIKNIFTKEK